MTDIQINKPNQNETNQKILRVYADGVFDMFHFGHALLLKQCHDLFPENEVHLIVGVSGEVETQKFKGKTIMNEFERKQSVLHCKWTNEVICPCPWLITPQFLEEQKIDYVCHDDAPYGSGADADIYAPIKKLGKFKATQRTDGISTSDLLNRIMEDRDDYILRNLKRGYSRKQMNVNLFDFALLKSKEFFHKFTCKRRNNKQKKE